MSSFYDTEEMIDNCAACGEELVKNGGRYIFDDKAYCPTCWGKGDVLINLSRGTISSSIAMKDEG